MRSLSGRPLGVWLASRACSAAGPWQVSQLMPGSAQDVLVAVRLNPVVIGELADVATETRGVERVRRFGPVQGLVRPHGNMAHRAARHVEPLLAPQIETHRQDLQPPALQRGQEIKDVLAAHRLLDAIAPPSTRTALDDDSLGNVSLETVRAGLERGFLLDQVGPRQRVCPHRQPVMRRRPQPVKLLVALPATGRTRIGPRRGQRGGPGCSAADHTCRERQQAAIEDRRFVPRPLNHLLKVSPVATAWPGLVEEGFPFCLEPQARPWSCCGGPAHNAVHGTVEVAAERIQLVTDIDVLAQLARPRSIGQPS